MASSRIMPFPTYHPRHHHHRQRDSQFHRTRQPTLCSRVSATRHQIASRTSRQARRLNATATLRINHTHIRAVTDPCAGDTWTIPQSAANPARLSTIATNAARPRDSASPPKNPSACNPHISAKTAIPSGMNSINRIPTPPSPFGGVAYSGINCEPRTDNKLAHTISKINC